MTYKSYEVLVYPDGSKEWWLGDKLHREDGPAIEWADGTKEWHLNGKLHREDGPAIELSDGSKSWYFNDKLHREDGPAIERADGSNSWYLDGWLVTEEKFNQKMNPCSGKVVEVDGVKYCLTVMKNRNT